MDKETSEIARLTGRISQDPKSKLFVPLAEEYKKAGDIEMGISVLLEGLKNNPDYVPARSSLGKLYLAKGDIAAAQKEFEEVVKTSPDNLMAQKKLGDISVFLKRPQDALPHYKTALSLNPNDEELTSLVLDLEAGRDVSSKIQLSMAKTTNEQAVKPEPPVSLPSREPAAAPISAPVSKEETMVQAEKPPELQAVSPAPDPEKAPASVSSASDTEEPEDVQIVEPLELETSEPELPVDGFDLTGEPEPEAVPAIALEERADADSFDSPAQNEPSVGDDISLEADLFKFEDMAATQPAVSEEMAGEEIVDAAFDDEITEKAPEAVPETVPEAVLEDVPDTSDDFTTDTLAELYIAQGFFEKAIEIYERMLVDKPSSRGLQDKLAWVRAEAEKSGTVSAGQKEEPEVHAEQEAKGYSAVDEDGAIEVEPSIFDELEGAPPELLSETADVTSEVFPEPDEYVPTIVPEEITAQAGELAVPDEFTSGEPSAAEDPFLESSEYKPAPETGEQPSAGGIDRSHEMPDAPVVQEPAKPRSNYLYFEPREYIPPHAERISRKPTTDKEDEAANAGTPQRKETIARLETWLTTIKKER